jgi:hypothetical protein
MLFFSTSADTELCSEANPAIQAREEQNNHCRALYQAR